jgi:AcrR family transcriptional regulator
VTTRRERLRNETIEEIKHAALAQIAEAGASALSVRGIARAIGMSPAGLYRYYDGIDALLTELITDAYTDLALTVEQAIDGTTGSPKRFEAGVRAYRSWAITHPNRFLLIFGTPIPGYAAPEGGPTVEANRRLGQAFFEIAAEGWAAGEMTAPPLDRGVTESEMELAEQMGGLAEGFPAEMIPALLGTWAHFHGLVTLEVLDQFHWMYPDPEVFFLGEVHRMLSGLMVGGVQSA